MRKWIIIAISLLVLGIIGAGIGYKYVYNKPHRDFDQATPDHVLSSAELFSSYLTDRTASENKYNGKVIQISGKLTSLEHTDSLHIVVFAMQEGMFGDEGIRCTLLPKYAGEAHNYSSNDLIMLKGYCTGYNDTDVILEQCSILK